MMDYFLAAYLVLTTNTTTITYKADIQPVFKQRCSMCHDYMPGKNWMNYKEAFDKRKEIKDRVLIKKDMPAGTDMPQVFRDLIGAWVDSGAKE